MLHNNSTRGRVKNVFEMELMNQVQDFEMGSVRAGVSWVCAKHMFRKYLGNEERNEDEADGGLISYFFEREQGLHKSHMRIMRG